MRVTVIVPLYHGEVYINKIIHQVKAAAIQVADMDAVIELVFVNDSVTELLGFETSSNVLDIHVLNNKVNIEIDNNPLEV